MWETLGFRESPYNTNPLVARAEDVELLVGRESEATEFCTQLEAATNGVLVLSGTPGVGKTSFFNVQQYKLENDLAPFGPKLLSARQLCPVQPTDDVKKLAMRALNSLNRSVENWCSLNGKQLPPETTKLGKWAAGTGTSGFTLGVSILGCGGSLGRTVQLPKSTDASFEAIGDAISAIAAEVLTEFGFSGVIIALDNLENLDDKQLGEMLISFRDTLFSIPNVWWVLIGQSGLGSLIQSLDPRVFERTTGSGIEIKPIEFEELEKAIALRVSRFHTAQAGKPPLTSETHQRLFEASFGEVRFVFKYSNSICAKFVERVRGQVIELGKNNSEALVKKPAFELAINKALGSMLVNNQMTNASAIKHLRDIVEGELKGLFLKPKEKTVLDGIGKAGQARASDYKSFALRSMQDFSSNYLTKFYQQNLLTRQQEGRAVTYRLRGVALLSHTFGFLSK